MVVSEVSQNKFTQKFQGFTHLIYISNSIVRKLRVKLTTWVWYFHLGVRKNRSNWLCHTSLSHGAFVFTSANPFPFGISCFGHFFPPPHWQRRHVDVLSRPSFRRRRAWVGHCRKSKAKKKSLKKMRAKREKRKINWQRLQTLTNIPLFLWNWSSQTSQRLKNFWLH